MDWTQFAIFFISFFGLFLWSRAESRSDSRHMDQKLDSNRELIRAVHEESKAITSSLRESMVRENAALRESMVQENRALREAILQESKDFHGRLCAIEERRLKLKQ